MFHWRNWELILKITVNFMSQVKTLDGLSRQTGNLDSLLSLFHSVFYQQQEQFVLQRSARLNLDPGEVTRVTGMTDDHSQDASSSE